MVMMKMAMMMRMMKTMVNDNKDDDDKGKLPKTPILMTMIRFLLP